MCDPDDARADRARESPSPDRHLRRVAHPISLLERISSTCLPRFPSCCSGEAPRACSVHAVVRRRVWPGECLSSDLIRGLQHDCSAARSPALRSPATSASAANSMPAASVNATAFSGRGLTARRRSRWCNTRHELQLVAAPESGVAQAGVGALHGRGQDLDRDVARGMQRGRRQVAGTGQPAMLTAPAAVDARQPFDVLLRNRTRLVVQGQQQRRQRRTDAATGELVRLEGIAGFEHAGVNGGRILTATQNHRRHYVANLRLQRARPARPLAQLVRHLLHAVIADAGSRRAQAQRNEPERHRVHRPALARAQSLEVRT